MTEFILETPFLVCAGRHAHRAIRDYALVGGLTASEAEAVVALVDGPLRSDAWAQRMACESSESRRISLRLRDRGLVTTEARTKPGVRTTFLLTPQGRAFAAQLLLVASEAVSALIVMEADGGA